MTEHKDKTREWVLHTNCGEMSATNDAFAPAGGKVLDLPARVNKIATSDEGKLQIVLEGEVIRPEELEKIWGMFLIQQGRAVTATRLERKTNLWLFSWWFR